MDYEDLIMALKNGGVPPEGANELCVGREKEIKEFQYLLKKVDQGKAITRFINGEFGSGKSFFLKYIEEMAYKDDFVVSKVTLGGNVPFNKIEIVYRNIVKNLRCKTGTSLEHIIEKWITHLKMMSYQQTDDPFKQNSVVKDNLLSELESARTHSNPFVVAIENYYDATNAGDQETANYAQAWLRGDSNIPYTYKRRFGVKGDVDRENAFKFIEALAAFVKSIGYSGLVVLIDEAEHILSLHTKKIRDVSYDYIRRIYDDCNENILKNTLFVFAGTTDFFDDLRRGVPSHIPLNERINENVLDTTHSDMRKPVIKLEGFKKEELTRLAERLMAIHEQVYDWNGTERIGPVLGSIVDMHESNAELFGGQVRPREFIQAFLGVLDTVQQNPQKLTTNESILDLFKQEEDTEIDEDDW